MNDQNPLRLHIDSETHADAHADAPFVPPDESGADPRRIAGEQLIHGLLSFKHAERPADRDRRMAALREGLARNEQPFPFRRPQWPLVAAAAAACLALGFTFLLGFPSDASAAASLVRDTLDASQSAGDRRYEVREIRGSKDTLEQEPRAILDVRDHDHVVLRATSPSGHKITVGRNEDGPWAIRLDGTVDRFARGDHWPRWANFGRNTMLLESVDELMEGLSKIYTLKKGEPAALPSGGSTKYDRITAIKKHDEAPEAQRIELWINRETKVARHIELHWNVPDAPEKEGDGPRDDRGPNGRPGRPLDGPRGGPNGRPEDRRDGRANDEPMDGPEGGPDGRPNDGPDDRRMNRQDRTPEVDRPDGPPNGRPGGRPNDGPPRPPFPPPPPPPRGDRPLPGGPDRPDGPRRGPDEGREGGPDGAPNGGPDDGPNGKPDGARGRGPDRRPNGGPVGRLPRGPEGLPPPRGPGREAGREDRPNGGPDGRGGPRPPRGPEGRPLPDGGDRRGQLRGQPGGQGDRLPPPAFLPGPPNFRGGDHPPPPKLLVFDLIDNASIPADWFTPEAHVEKDGAKEQPKESPKK
jgi:hypothetical protein